MSVEESTSLLDKSDESKNYENLKQIREEIEKRQKDKDETLNEQEFDRYLQQELDIKFPSGHLKVLQQNLLYFAFVLICIGLPIWWVTTSPYRAALQSIDPTIKDVVVPVNLTFHYESTISLNALKSLVNELSDENPELRIISKFIKIDGETKSIDKHALNIVLLTSSTFSIKFPNAMRQTRGYFVNENVLTINYVDKDSLFSLISRVLGTERLKSISNLELQQNLSAWDRIPISTLYHLHLVFLHDNGAQDSKIQSKIMDEARKISKFVSKYGVLVDVSATHLWDFDVESFVTTEKSNERRLLIQDVEMLTTEVDKYVNWMGVGIAQPLVKMAIFVSNEKVKLLNSKGQSFNGFAIASWGGISSLSLQDQSSTLPVLHSILDTLKTQLNVHAIESDWNVEFDKSKVAHEFEWQRFVMQTFREHVQIASSSLHSIHALKQKIENLVISKEVAVDVYEAHEVLMATLLQARVHSKIDMFGAIRARILAERAVKHSSTLQHLNFPMEQRYAIYVPLFLPVFVHLLSAVWHMLKLIPASIRRHFKKSQDSAIEYFPYLFESSVASE